MKLGRLVLFLTLILGFGFGLGAQNKTYPQILIFTYPAPVDGDKQSVQYASYAIPDLLRERLLAEGRYKLIERRVLAEKMAAIGLSAGAVLSADQELQLARACGADYYVSGYFLFKDAALLVMHRLVECREGTTVYQKSTVLPEGPELFGTLEASAIDLTDRSRDLIALPTITIVVKDFSWHSIKVAKSLIVSG